MNSFSLILYTSSTMQLVRVIGLNYTSWNSILSLQIINQHCLFTQLPFIMTTWPLHIKAAVCISAISGSISSLASITIIVSILRSNVKLSTVYRRLIFGMSVFDLIQSMSLAFSAGPIPAGLMWGAYGNDVTCDLQAFTTIVGGYGSMLYSLSLSVYFVFVMLDIPESRIKKYLEPIIHTVSISAPFAVGIYLYVIQFYNAADTICWVVPQELRDCLLNGEISIKECMMKWKHYVDLVAILLFYPKLFIFAGNCIALFIIWYIDFAESRKRSNLYKSALSGDRHRNSQMPSQGTRTGGSRGPVSPLAERLSRPSNSSLQRRKTLTRRAIAYIAGFILTYIFSFIYRFLVVAGYQPHFMLDFLSKFFLPLQGFFNLLIYTYPHVVSYRQSNPRSTYFRALWEVVKSGGDSDRSRRLRATGTMRFRRARRRRNSMRNEPVVTEPINQNIANDAIRVQTQYLDSTV
jgi:hypothetical protein